MLQRKGICQLMEKIFWRQLIFVFVSTPTFSLNIMDNTGKKVYFRKIARGITTINITNLLSGIYTIQTLNSASDIQTIKFIKQ